MKISIIGGGNMGNALCRGFLKTELTPAKNIFIADSDTKKLKALQKLGVWTGTDNQKILKSDILILAVKPQSFIDLAKEISGKIPAKTIVLSIMAGISSSKISKLLRHQKIVRAMPNTPALVNEGVTGWFTNKNISAVEKKTIQKILSATGYAFEMKSESQIDDVTALSGCGPGFFFRLIESWHRAAKKLDLKEEQSFTALIKTLKGSLTLLETSQESPAELAQKVASKGGATEAGLRVLQQAKLEKTFAKMMKAAYNRSKQLG